MTVVAFADPVRDWIIENLAAGCGVDVVREQLVAHRMAPELARAMVSAVSGALLFGLPMPEGSLRLDAPEPVYVPGPGRIGSGAALDVGDRFVPVLARWERPGIALLGRVFDDDECEALIEAARPRLAASTLVDPTTGRDAASHLRRSEGMFFQACETSLLDRLDRRLAALVGLPLAHAEGLQVLRYPAGAESTPHFDFLMPTNAANRASVARSGQRVSTLIVYLNDVAAGGETTFPHLGLAITPRRGHAVYFEYANDAGGTDPLSLHAGAPVTAGEKWIATRWTRARPFVPAG